LQEWCTGSGCNTAYIPPSSPWENALVESFNSRLRDEFLNIELLTSVQEVKFLAEQNLIEYITTHCTQRSKAYAPGSHPAIERNTYQLSDKLDQKRESRQKEPSLN